MKKNILLVTVLAVVFVLLSFLAKMDFEKLSYIKISINPEIELAVNEENVVVEVIPINDDASIFTSDLDLVGMPVDEALNTIVDSSIETGYIDEYDENNAILVTVINDDEEIREELEKKVMTKVQERLDYKKVSAVLAAVKLGDELKAEALEYDISNGKMLLVEEALALDSSLDKEELVTMSIKDIQAIIKEQVEIRKEEFKLTKEELKAKKEELKEKYSEKIDALKKQVQDRISNFQSLTEEQKKEAIRSGLENIRTQVSEKFVEVKEEVTNYLEEKNYSEVKENVVNQIREIFKNRGN